MGCGTSDDFMTLGGFVVRNTFRNKRRSMLTMLSISFSLLLLTLMMSIWRTFYIDQGRPGFAAKRSSLGIGFRWHFFCPAYYRDKIRSRARSGGGCSDDLVWQTYIRMTGQRTSLRRWPPIRTSI